MNRSRTPSGTLPPATTCADSSEEFKFSQEENDSLNSVLASLSGKQFQAARMEAAGFDASTIANTVKVVPQTITFWRRNPDYTKAVNLFLSIINKMGIKFRLDCQRAIIAPAYAELMRRMNAPRMLMKLEHRDLLNTIKTIGKETRLDQELTGSVEDNEELRDLQERRSNFSYARQAQAIEELKQQGKIINFPTGTHGS